MQPKLPNYNILETLRNFRKCFVKVEYSVGKFLEVGNSKGLVWREKDWCVE